MNHSSVNPQTVMVNNITNHNNMKHSSQTSNSNGQQYNQPEQYEPLLCQTSYISGQEYNQPQQYEPLLCQTWNSNG
jgi:hypothetical protein